MSDMNNPSDENSGALDDLWADALNEQKAPRPKAQRMRYSSSSAAVTSAARCRIST
jgi:hypothetical protein